jgi:ABC-2 type transport system ATP-binding protein
MTAIISIKNLSKSYGVEKAVDGLNLSIAQGEFYGFLGPNGAGKTTTIRMITGVLEPDEGDILVDGNHVHEKQYVAKNIGVVPEGRSFYEWMTAEEYLYFFANLYSVPKDKQVTLIDTLLTEVDLSKRRHSRIGTYSRGMRQRLGLARALINSPRLLILDEPTLGLDPQGQEDVQKLLKKLNAGGVTIFLSSHLLDEVSRLCTRIGILNNGRLLVEGTESQIREKTHMKDKNLTEIFLHLTRTYYVHSHLEKRNTRRALYMEKYALASDRVTAIQCDELFAPHQQRIKFTRSDRTTMASC